MELHQDSPEIKKSFDLVNELVLELMNHRDIQLSRTGVLNIDSERITHKNIEKEMAELFRNEPFTRFQSLLFAFNPATKLLDVMKRSFKFNQIQAKNSDIDSSKLLASFSYDNFRPIVNIERNNAPTFINTKTHKVANLSYDIYEKFVPKELRREPIFGKIVFNPYTPKSLYLEEVVDQMVTCANQYRKPEWQYDRELTPAEKLQYSDCPPLVLEFFTNLFPSKTSREFVFDWLHHAITKRCETYLVLNGAKGIGKGILTDTITKTLMGRENHRVAAPSILDSNFNSILENCRMIILDEMPINDSEKIAKLKKYINKDQGIENKAKDVGQTVETFNSFIISSNSVRDMLIEWDDRRFSVADMTTTKLNKLWSFEKIKEFVEIFEDSKSDMVREFGYWLIYREPQGDNFKAYKGAHFHKLCYSSLPEWSRTIIDEVTSGMYDTLDDVSIKMKFKERSPQGRFPTSLKVEEFVNNYLHEGEKSLGQFIKQDNGGFEISVSDHFYSGRDNLGVEWVDAGDLL